MESEFNNRNFKNYELKDHLDNVRLVFSDMKLSSVVDGSCIITNPPTISVREPQPFDIDLVAVNNYYPFGMLQPGQIFSSESYRFGFNGKENDNEVKGTGNSIDFGDRSYDPRTTKWMRIDSKDNENPFMSPYTAFGDNPILFIDENGEDYSIAIDHSAKTIIIKATFISLRDNLTHNNNRDAGIEFWNSQNGKYQYVIGEGENSQRYELLFQLEPKEGSYLDNHYEQNIENPYNMVMVLNNEEYNLSNTRSNSIGIASQNNVVLNSEHTGNSDELTHHEFGHVLGARHNPIGVMNPTLSSFDNTIMDNINDILGQAGIGINKSIQGGQGANNTILMGQPLNVKEINIENKPEGFENGSIQESTEGR